MINTRDNLELITKFIQFRRYMCDKHNNDCKQCPLIESTDGWVGENGKYAYIDNCKFDFDAWYVEDILKCMDENQDYEQNADFM